MIMNIKLEKKFKYIVLFTLVCNVFLLVFPYLWPYFYSGEVIQKIVWSNGFDAKFILNDFIIYGISLVYLVCYLGLLKYQNWARNIYAVMVVFVLSLNLIGGIFSLGNIDSFLNHLICLLDGIVISLCFFSPMSKLFENDA